MSIFSEAVKFKQKYPLTIAWRLKRNSAIVEKHLNPEEAVARGAAIQAAMLSKLSSIKNMGLLDVTNLSFGVCSEGYKMSKVIKRSTPLPANYSQIYATFYDNQTEALIEIFEGEDKQTKNNLCLDKLLICGLPKMKKIKQKLKLTLKLIKIQY